MKIRSPREIEVEQDLRRLSQAIPRDPSCAGLMQALRQHFEEIQNVYLIDCIPEQAEDIYRVVVRSGIVTVVEVPRGDPSRAPQVAENIPVKQFTRFFASKHARRKLQAVRRLLAEDEQHDRA